MLLSAHQLRLIVADVGNDALEATDVRQAMRHEVAMLGQIAGKLVSEPRALSYQ